MKPTAVLVVAGLLGLVALPATAQEYLNEISIVGSWDDVEEPANTEVTNIQLRYARLTSQQFAATAALSRTRFEAPGTDTSTTTFLVGAKYYIHEQREGALVPFLDAAIGLAHTDTGPSDSTDFAWEFGGGAAFFLSRQTSIDAAIRFYRTDTDIETEGTRLFVGITTRF